MTDWRSLCAELVDLIDVGMHPDYIDHELFQRAIAALNAPPDAPSAFSQCHLIATADRNAVASASFPNPTTMDTSVLEATSAYFPASAETAAVGYSYADQDSEYYDQEFFLNARRFSYFDDVAGDIQDTYGSECSREEAKAIANVLRRDGHVFYDERAQSFVYGIEYLKAMSKPSNGFYDALFVLAEYLYATRRP